MPKPNLDDTRWATTASPTTPSSTQRDTGWTAGQVGVSDYANILARGAHAWFAYLDAGLWEDDLAITGDLSVLGAFVGPVNVTGTVEADGLYFRQTETRQLSIHSGLNSFGTHASGYHESTGAAQIVDIVIDLPLGAKIYGYSFRYRGNGVDNLIHRLVKVTDGVETPVGEATIVAPTATWQTAFNNFVPEQVYLGTTYLIRVTSGGSGQRVGAPSVDWTREAP